MKILYVEDEPDIRMLARMAMEAIGGHTVTECASGAEALSAVRGGDVPELIVLDMMMPEMDGRQTLAALRALPETAAIPAIFMTAKTQADEIAAGSEGVIGVISKPFDPMTLAERITTLLQAKR